MFPCSTMSYSGTFAQSRIFAMFAVDPEARGLHSVFYIYLIAWVSDQYGKILHECAEVFSRVEGEGKYCTRMQCLAIDC